MGGLTRLRGGEYQTAEGPRRVAPVDLNDADIADSVRMVEVGNRLMRIGTGLPTDSVRSVTQISPQQSRRCELEPS